MNMQRTYIARQAIFDRKSNTVGYELLFRNSPKNTFPDIDQDIATSKLIIQSHIHGDITALSMGKPAYINFTEKCLINKYPLMFDKNSIVIELVGQRFPTERLIKIIKYYFDKGFKLALTQYNLDERWDVIFPYLSVIKVDIEVINPKRMFRVLTRLKPHNIKLVAEKVETKYQYQSLIEVGFNYYQGFFYHEPEIIEGQTLTPIKTQMLQLMSETFNTHLNYEAIANIISHDVNLTIGLLKMVNNVATGTRIEITCVKQAITYLGEEKLKQFVSILALSKLTTDETDEISKQALITGKLMLAIATKEPFREAREFAFITGILSAIEVILNMPIAEVVKTMPLAKPIEQALIDHSGVLGELLVFVTDYVTGKSENISETIKAYAIYPEFIQHEFVEASRWCLDLTD